MFRSARAGVAVFVSSTERRLPQTPLQQIEREFYPVVKQSASGEHRLPACSSRQLAETSHCIQSRPELVDRPQMLPASCRQLQAGSLRSPE